MVGQCSPGKTIPQIAASLAAAGLVSTLAPPAWVIVATSILAAKIFESGLDASARCGANRSMPERKPTLNSIARSGCGKKS